MFRFKNLDFFRKTDQTRSTITGGIISLLSLACIVLLVMTRLSEYLTPVVKKDLFVTSNMEVDPVIALHMDIVFPNTPCGILDFKFQTGYSIVVPKLGLEEIDCLLGALFNL